MSGLGRFSVYLGFSLDRFHCNILRSTRPKTLELKYIWPTIPENCFPFWKRKSYGSWEWLQFLERKELWFLRMASFYGNERVMVPENRFMFWKWKSYGSWEWLHFLERKELWFLRMASFYGKERFRFLIIASLFGNKRAMVPENGYTFWKRKSYGS